MPEANVPGGLRFRPPEVVVSKEIAWVLLRAFSPLDARAFAAISEEGAALARRLDLAPRIAARTPRPRLEAEAGPHGARALVAAQGVAALDNERLLEVCREAASCAAEAGVPLVVLKGMALHLTGRTELHARSASDVDFLVDEAHLGVVAEALRQRGFRSDQGGPPCEHQLPPLQRRPGENVDVHRFLPGVRIPGEREFASALSLRRRGLLQRLPNLPGDVSVPTPAVLAAHALVHGIAQHGFAPGSYPSTRMLADLLDLGVGDERNRDLWGEGVGFTSAYVRPGEAEAAWGLCAGLRLGDILSGPLRPGRRPADALLAHVLAGALDPTYRGALKLRVLGSGPSLLPWPLAWVRDAAGAVWPRRGQIEALHGRPLSPLRATALRIARPFDLARRVLRAARSRVAIRARPRTFPAGLR